LTDHLQRMWTRFNFFVTIESALASGKFLIASNVPSVELTVTGIVLSLIWYVMGAQDRFLVDLYRTEVQSIGTQYARAARGDTEAQAYSYVGRTDADYIKAYGQKRETKRREWGSLQRWLDRLSSWRSESFSTTHLAAFIPLFATGLWAILL